MLGKLMDAMGLGPVVEMRGPDDLQPGKALVHGTVSAPATIPSPVNRRPCVAFYYRASYQRPSRLKGFQQELLRDALVYAPDLVLDVDGTSIALQPKRNDDFDAELHAALKASGMEGFRGLENRIPDRAQVRASGRLKRTGDQWLLELDALHYDPPPPKPGSSSPAKSTKKKARR